MTADRPDHDPDRGVYWGGQDVPAAEGPADVEEARPTLPAPSGPTIAPTGGRQADPFSEAALLQPRRASTRQGARGLVDRLLGRTAEEAPDPEVLRCRRPVPGGRRIAVISRKGGVGKTTTTMLLGHTLAAARGDRVLAIDGNPDAGTLAHRVERQSPATVTDALARLDQLHAYPDARALTSQATSRLEVLASPEDPLASTALTGADYQRLMDALHPHYTLLLCDTGTGILDDATTGILQAVDQVVLVAGAALDTARAAALTLDWLDANGAAALVADAVVVITVPEDLGRVDLDGIISHFYDRTRAVHLVPWDRHLESGAVIDPDRLAPATQAAWLSAAASVADGFALPSPRDLPRR